MKNHSSKRHYLITTIYLAATLLMGLAVTFLPLDKAECALVLYLQTFMQKSLGILLFRVLTYLGELYLWVIFSSIYFFYTFLKSRKRFSSAVKLVTFLMIVTALTYVLKPTFARPRPHCSNVTVYEQDAEFSYPSGHVSRATGALAILSGKNRATRTLIVVAVFLLSISRIILGVHYFTDVIGAVFLSLAAQNIANLAIPRLRLPDKFPH